LDLAKAAPSGPINRYSTSALEQIHKEIQSAMKSKKVSSAMQKKINNFMEALKQEEDTDLD
jgi:hypothetical protein